MYHALRNAYRILATKSEGNRPLGRHSHRWKNNIETCPKERGPGANICSRVFLSI
jgi:hypothetical protein